MVDDKGFSCYCTLCYSFPRVSFNRSDVLEKCEYVPMHVGPFLRSFAFAGGSLILYYNTRVPLSNPLHTVKKLPNVVG